MFNLFKKQSEGHEVTLTIKGMHCPSCAVNIDGALEDTEGIVSAETSYARAQVKVQFDPEKVSEKRIKEIITAEGYESH